MARAPNSQIASLTAGYVVAGFFWGAFAASTPDFQAISGRGPAGFGWLLLTLTAGAFPAMLLVGRLMPRIERWAMPGCLAFFALGTLVLSRADGTAGLVAGLFLCGAASGGLDVSLNMRSSRIEEATGLRLFNRMHATFPLALLAASPLTGAARDAGASPATVFPVVAALLLAAAAVELRAGTHKRPARADGAADRPVRLTAVFALLGILAALGAFLEMSAQSWAVIFTETVLGASATAASLSAAGFTLGLSAGRFLAHMIENRVSHGTIIAGAAALGVPAFALIAASPTVGIALAGFFAAGVATGPVEPTVFSSVAARTDPARRGRALSIATMIAYLGYLVSPPILGSVAGAIGWPGMWLTTAAVAAATAALALALGRAGAGLSRPAS